MEFDISDKKIGEGYPTFIIAELSANHMNDFDIAVKTIEAMADAGVDAVKFQTFTPDTITIDCDNEYFHIKIVIMNISTLNRVLFGMVKYFMNYMKMLICLGIGNLNLKKLQKI